MNKVGSLLTTSARYVESHESGAFSDSIEAGVRTRVVTNVYTCYKSEAKTILNGVDLRPTELLSAGGRNPDGTPANYVNWGAGYELTDTGVSDLSPNFSKLTIRYKATDPTGGAAVAGDGSPLGGIVGRPWEGGNRYIETQASGKVEDSRVYLSDSFGWNIGRVVDVALICEKVDSREIADALPLEQTSLTTNPHNESSVAWGGPFDLVSIYGAPMSPSFYAITAKYRRNMAEAIHRPPAGLDLRCDAGVCSIWWNDVKFEDMDSGTGVCTQGIDVQIINGYTCLMTCNGVPFSSSEPTDQTGDKILEWEIDGNSARLMWCGNVWKAYMT